MKKILISFVLGLMLSVIPITGLALSGNKIKLDKLSNTVGKAFNITRLFVAGCPATISVPMTIQQGNVTIEADVTCNLTGESPDTGDGVSVCSYSCIVGSV